MNTLTINRNILPSACAIIAIVALSPRSSLATDDDAVNPHWNSATCQTCHIVAMPTLDNHDLQTEDAGQLCESCHGNRGSALPCRHRSDIPAGDYPIPDSYRAALKDGQLACTTCHDLTVQCLSPHKSHSFTNPGFIRDRRSRNRAESCLECHDTTGFERLNPHAVDTGDPAQPMCTLCHATMPVQDERGWLAVDFNMRDSLNDICLGCHKVEPHPGSSFSIGPASWNHLAVPSAEILENMKQAEQRLGFVFPLGPSNGEIHCATCHNPHDAALEGYSVADTPGSEYRLRVENNCQACHDL